NDTVMVVAGDVDAETVHAQVERLLGGWHRVPQDSIHLPGAAASGDPRTIVSVMAGKSQVDVWVGAPGLVPDHPRPRARVLLGFMVGGQSFVSKLLHQVRDVDGYVYSIGSHFSQTSVGGGPWTMSFGADPRHVHDAIAEVQTQMRTLQDGVLSDAELAEYRR